MLAGNNGIVPSIVSAMKMRTLIQLPGIVELLARTDKKDIDSHRKEMESFVGAVVFFVGDKKTKLNNAKADLRNFDGSSYVDCAEFLI